MNAKNKHASKLGKIGGSRKSKAKSKSSKRNGKLGGRPTNKTKIQRGY